MPTAALYGARPVIEIDGRSAPELTSRTLSLIVTETTEGMARCELAVGNWNGAGDSTDGYVFNRRDLVDFGQQLTVRLGDGDRAGTVFAGHVSAIEAHYPAGRAPEIVFLAEDRLQSLRQARRTRSFEDMSDDDIVHQVVAAHGLTAATDIDGPSHRHVAQVNQSDLAFLRDRARLLDADLWIEDDTVHVVARSRRRNDPITLTYRADLLEVSVRADLAGQCTSYVVAGWDVGSKDAIQVDAGSGAIQPELDGEVSGLSLMDQAFGTRVETIVHTTPTTVDEARARADMAMRTAARRFVTAHGRAEGDARLRVGARAKLAGLGTGFDGAYTLVEVEHCFDPGNGYQTRFRAERPGLGVVA